MNEHHARRALRRHYGPDPEQYGHLHVSHADPEKGIIVLFHGGFWRSHRDLSMTTPMAQTLTDHGWNVWNVEYRRGEQATWQATTADCEAATGYVAVLAEELGVGIEPALLVGHSAGAHLAAWAAANAPRAAARDFEISGLVTLNGVLDLEHAASTGVGEAAVSEYLGAMPEDRPGTYRSADPAVRMPPELAARCLHSRQDERVPFALTERFVGSARTAGSDVRGVEITGHHTAPIEPGSDVWPTVVSTIDSLTHTTADRLRPLQEFP